ncbi:MAG TPA: glutaredoxin family protein [Candidatus Eisenbacteria bacterium]|nr:glutaredoxin family protein [Candidatus Eisenbacteria bacterium]
MNEHPEDLRLTSVQALDVTIYSRPGCHLCEAAKSAIDPLLAEFGAPMHEINIDDDPVLVERYGWDIPVIFIGGRKAAKHKVNVKQFRRQLQEAKEGAATSAPKKARKKGA